MNETSATSQSGASLLPDGIGALTAVHLVIVALLAIVAVAIIVVGARRKRLRIQAAREVARHAEQAGVPAPSAEPDKAPEPAPLPSPPPPPPPPVTTPDRTSPAPTPLPTPLDDEPIAAAAPMDASPASEAAAAESPAPAPAADADQPVTMLKGLGPKVSAALADRGITTVGQLAALDDDAAAALDAELGTFRGRMARDRWIEQARFLAAGDRAGFEAVFGKL